MVMMEVQTRKGVQWGPLQEALTHFVAGFMVPVYLGDAPFASVEQAKCFNGTATLVHLGGRYLAVTCSHVLAAYRDQGSIFKRPHFQIGHLSLDPAAQLVDEDPKIDLAVLEILPSQVIDEDFPELGLPRKRFFGPAIWPPEPVTNEDVVSFAGFPGTWREQNGVNSMSFFMFSHGAAGVYSAGENHFYSKFEIEICEGKTYYNKKVVDLGGMSGGPVFRWRSGQVRPDLVGFITEYQASLDLLHIRSSRVLGADGRLRRS
jgi:hypothetical protein